MLEGAAAMSTSRLACRLLVAACLFGATCGSAWAYGWTGHWRVMEAAWPSLSAGVCDGQPHPHPFPPDILSLDHDDIALAAGLGAIVSDIGYITASTEQFSDLMHYIGTGNYLDNLVAITCEKYGNDPAMVAFLAGMRSHYWADRVGHHEGTNVAVAMLSDTNRDKALTRVVYEQDIAMHKRLELGAFSAYDLRHGGLRVAVRFIAGGREFDRVVERVRYVMALAAAQTFGKAAEQFVPDYAKILLFTAQVADSVCTSAAVTFRGTRAPDSAAALLDACRKIAETPARTDAQKDPGVRQLATEGYALTERQPALEAIYERSIAAVTDALRQAHKGPLPNYNLDTNLPAVGGQYRHADAAYLRLGASASGACDPAHAEAAGKLALRDWTAFQPAGLCVRHASDAPRATLACGAPPPVAVWIASRWLWDLAPMSGNPPPDACKPTTLHWQQTTLRLDAHCELSANQPLRTAELILACAAVRGGQGRGGRDDALDRLRLAPREYGPIDPATGLYR